ncbi:hypothetical protein CI109_105314 [Kwoniella shandongensis]|uniref:thioredoxin-dependent peroxiredoxin n=1 Tax=Kwoniella shandongensis TaxID=1734106 RepID=A0A5M6BUT0_9TREE|nr:uncharacterized protein CI109_004997 [Kwoniella shandongensis]KAA5526607.1 hypothetical protein CI109_004997 [Kwoniella shandongensis]
MVKASTLIGKPAPHLELPAIPNGELYKLPIGEKPIALFFFPAAGTMGCTMEACSFRDAQVENIVFKRNPELAVVGISGDPTTKQASFADQHKLPYPIICDQDGIARKAYGVGKAFLGLTPGRETFFIDQKGVVRGVCDKSIDVKGHIKFVEEHLRQLEKESSSTPTP